ncbi:MAG: DNA polymerase Y family protein [Planctomycetaceae bacterium]|nr:DNA polymerase Y family protein [Planctomycetaceae bacterium]
MNSTKKRILCIWLPDWPVLRQTLDRGEPFEPGGPQSYRRQPIVLHETVHGSRRVAACSAKARALGITVGMPLSEAAALLEVGDTCRVSQVGDICRVSSRSTPISGSKPKTDKSITVVGQDCILSRQVTNLSYNATVDPAPVLNQSHPAGATHLVWPHDPRADREALERLAVWCHRYSPLVGLDDAVEPDSLLLDVTGVARFFDGEEALGRRILTQFARRGILVRVGLAVTIGAAWAAARYGKSGKQKAESGGMQEQDRLECRWLRRRAVDSPPGSRAKDVSPSVAIVPSDHTDEFLAAMPLAALRLSDEILDLLRQLGLQRVGQLDRLPRADFNARFGPELLRRWDQAAGRLDEPIVALPLPQQFEAEQFFEHPVGDRATLEFVLNQLIQRIAQMATIAGRGALRVEVHFDCRTSGNLTLEVGLFRPSASAEHLFGLVQMRLERLRLPGKVETATVRFTETAPLERHQAELFDSGTVSQHSRQTADLIDRLASRLGRDRILGVRLLAEAQPERAYRYESLVGKRRPPRRTPPRDLPPRPLKLLRRPIRLAAVAIVPDGPPLHFTLPSGRQRVARSWGPERIQTGWWRGQPIHRDYYRVETTTGTRYWLFRRRTDGGWFLHGVFH